MTRYFPEVVEAIKANLPERCVIDGEIVVPDPEVRRLEFETLQQRIHPAASRVRLLAETTPAHFVAFDLLALGDADLMRRPFAERRAALEAALADARSPIHVTPATTDEELARRWFDEFEGAGLDGVVAKPLEGTYQPDKRVMFKIKHERTADCVVAGYRLHKSGPDAIGSLLLGLYDDAGVLANVGVIGAFPMDRRRALLERAAAVGHDVRRASVGLGSGDGRRADASERRGQPLEPEEGPLVRAAAARARGRGAVRPHGGQPVPAHGPVRPVATRPRSAFVHVRAARGAGRFRPRRDPRAGRSN